MKKNYAAFLMAILLIGGESYATIRRVGYTEVTHVGDIDYASFFNAYTAAVSGDTIYVFPGKTIGGSEWNTSYHRPTITKKLIIISKGNWLDTASVPKGNTGMQAGIATAYFGTDYIIFNPGSEGSVLMGFNGSGNNVFINTDKITLKRNFNLGVRFGSISVNTTYTLIEGNYRIWFFVDGDDNINNTWANVNIRNNFIYYFQIPLKSYSGTIENNTWAVDGTGADNGGDVAMSQQRYYSRTTILLRSGSWMFQNNLIIGYYSTSAASNNAELTIAGAESTTFKNNVALKTSDFKNWPGGDTSNIFLDPAKVADIFEAFPAIGKSSADSRYRLKANSPARKGRVYKSEVDAGMYGGNTPYKLSTIPPIPTIYMISSPQGSSPAGNTLQINISTRSNN